MWPNYTFKNMIWTWWHLHYLIILPHKSQHGFWEKKIIKKKIFKDFFSIYSYVKIAPLPMVPLPNLRHTDLIKLQHNLQLVWPIGFWKKSFWKICLYISFILYNCGSTLPPGNMIWTNLNLHDLRMLRHKFQLFQPNVFWEDLLKIWFKNHSPFRYDLALHSNIFECHLHKVSSCQVWLKLAKWF